VGIDRHPSSWIHPFLQYSGEAIVYLGAVKESGFDGVHEGDVEVALLEACRQLQQQIEDAVVVPPDHVKDAADHQTSIPVNRIRQGQSFNRSDSDKIYPNFVIVVNVIVTLNIVNSLTSVQSNLAKGRIADSRRIPTFAYVTLRRRMQSYAAGAGQANDAQYTYPEVG